MGARRVYAETYEFNRASRRVMEKLGMRQVRSFGLTEEEVGASGGMGEWEGDEVEYAITREEWEGM